MDDDGTLPSPLFSSPSSSPENLVSQGQLGTSSGATRSMWKSTLAQIQQAQKKICQGLILRHQRKIWLKILSRPSWNAFSTVSDREEARREKLEARIEPI